MMIRELQWFLTTAEEEQMYNNCDQEQASLPPPDSNGILPAGVYRVVDGELYRIVDGHETY